MVELTRIRHKPAPRPGSRGGEGLFVWGRQAVRRAWRGWRRGGDAIAGELDRDLRADALDRVRQRIASCLEGRGGAASARAIAADLGRAYLSLSGAGKERFFELLFRRYGADAEELKRAAAAMVDASNPAEFAAAQERMGAALVPPRLKLLRQFNGLEEGVKFLVDMRADFIEIMNDKGHDADYRAFDREFRELLTSWFDVGFLDLRRITWEAPAALLEKLVAYEAVHEIRSWADLKDRLDSDRRCYAFFHPSMPDEPLIFVEVALVRGMAARIAELLDDERPASDPDAADTAVFYSISNAQKGLSGVSFGHFLIKQVVSQLARDFPRIKHFATLSPIPGFREWLGRTDDLMLRGGEADAIGSIAGGSDPAAFLLSLFDSRNWTADAAVSDIVRPLLMRLCARYLTSTVDSQGGRRRAVDVVAHFHLSNGARIERLNWLADTSDKGITQSAGMMANYLYKLSDIEQNHEDYKSSGEIRLAGAVKALI